MPGHPPPTFAVENLESRLNLSTLSTLFPTTPSSAGANPVQTVSSTPPRVYRYGALSAEQSGSTPATYGASWSNTTNSDAQRFFDQFKSNFSVPSPYIPSTPTPVPPPPPPPLPTPTGNPVTISQVAEGNLTRLVITGTSGDDSIFVSQSGDTLTIDGNGITSSVTGTFGEIAIYGGNGNDSITVDSSVNITSLLYGGAGINTLVAAGSAQSFIVTIGAGTSTVTGNGIDTAFWVNPGDTVHASSTEIAGGDVHVVSSFYGGVSTLLAGQTLPEPSDSGTMINMSDRSLFGTGPAMTDINQGQLGDCYFLASLQSFANDIPARLEEMAVDLGDGTYAVQFMRGGTPTYVRVDADLPVASWGGLLYNSPSAGGPIWASIMEKAYAFFRTGAGTYASLNNGWTGSVFSDLGVANTSFSTSGNAATLYNTISSALSASKAVAIISIPTASSPIIASHAYSIVAASTDLSGTMWITVRNPWGYDGAGNDGDPSDGLVTITLAQLQSNFSMGSISI